MKKIVMLVLVVAMVFASSGLIQACELCDKLRQKGYSNSQIAALIRGSANRAEAESRLRRAITKGIEDRSLRASISRPVENRSLRASTARPAEYTATTKAAPKQPALIAETSSFKFSDETIEVPPDNHERR